MSEHRYKVGQAVEFFPERGVEHTAKGRFKIVRLLESIKIAASKAVRFHAGKTVKVALNPPRSVGIKKSGRPKRSVGA